MAIDINLDCGELGCSGRQNTRNGDVSVVDALVLSIRNRHCVDMAYIAEMAGLVEDEAADSLDGSVFLDPDTGEWQTSGVYLSGDLGHKLEAARGACGRDAFFERNVTALEKAMPPKIPASEIYCALGSPWVPEDVILDFIHHLMPASTRIGLEIVHDPRTGSWNVKGKWPMRLWPGSVEVWGTKRAPALDILEGALNGRDVRIYDDVEDPNNRSGFRKVLNNADTMEALEKQQRMGREFAAWIWSDAARASRLEDIFNRHYGRLAVQRFDGSCLEFPGMSPNVKLRPYQRDAVMRMLLRKNVLLAHDVGAGKTYTCIAAGMEMKRIDPSERVLYVVPNNVVAQWADLFSQMYPLADVLVVHPKSFGKARRQDVLADIRDGGHDAVIMAQSSFDLVPVSARLKREELDARIVELDEALADPARATSAVKAERSALVKRRDKMAGEPDGYDGICFDELGVTRLFVDEAHNYKNLAIGGHADVQGFGGKGSKKCEHMLSAVRCTMRAGGSVVFATGTVLVNSIADCYTFQRYLQPATLANLDLADFDAWCGMFAQKRTSWEIDVDTSSYRFTTRFSGFGNLDVLSSLLGCVADFHHIEPGGDLPECEGREDVVVARTGELAEYLQDLSSRADRVRRGRVRSKDDNLLAICTDGRKAALDVRLVDDSAEPGPHCKVSACAANVARIWRETAGERLTQLVFCDMSTPREGFNVYDGLKQALVALGIPGGEVAFVHDAHTEFAQSRLFADVRKGKVRVLIGSTPKLGLGVNVQDRLVAAHHLDVPWKPADMTQREGRILRFGNMNRKVEIYRYVTEGSFDAYSWQIVERKQRAIDELLAGTFEGGWLESDVGKTALSYGEVKALAVGNPMLRERVEAANELERARILQRRGASARARLADKVSDIVGAVERVETELAACSADADFAATAPASSLTLDEKTYLGAGILEAAKLFADLGSGCKLRPSYRGFDLYVPDNADPEHPSLLLVREGRWPVDLGEGKARGVFTRLENAVRGLSKRREELEARLEILYGNWEQAERELAEAGGGIAAEIERLKARLSEIDLKLEEEALAKEADEDEQ
ncbi:MAG: DEAD/DEAH box helicase family protein [Eggerthellaceae bacterium]|nr:DEAD/DEAH box helicase family protein [Eggerthellaceae bacterium]